MINTTLNHIRAHSPCKDGWVKLLAGLGKTRADDEPLSYATILEINGIEDAIWCCRAEPQEAKTWRLFAVWCVRQVQHLMTDQRAIDEIDVAERYANGLATDKELFAEWVAASAAAYNRVLRADALSERVVELFSNGYCPIGAAYGAAWHASWNRKTCNLHGIPWYAARAEQAKQFRKMVS